MTKWQIAARLAPGVIAVLWLALLGFGVFLFTRDPSGPFGSQLAVLSPWHAAPPVLVLTLATLIAGLPRWWDVPRAAVAFLVALVVVYGALRGVGAAFGSINGLVILLMPVVVGAPLAGWVFRQLCRWGRDAK